MYLDINVLLHTHTAATCGYVCHLGVGSGVVRNAAASFGVRRAGSFAHRRASSYSIQADILLLPSYHLYKFLISLVKVTT